MQNKHRRLLEELDSIAIPRDRVHLIESRAQHIIASATNLIELIKERTMIQLQRTWNVNCC